MIISETGRSKLKATLVACNPQGLSRTLRAVLSEAGDLIIPMVKGPFSADIIKAEVGEILLG